MDKELRPLGIDLLRFDNPAALLRAYSEARGSKSGSWSVSVWARMLRLKSASLLFMALHGERRIGKALEAKLADYFGLTKAEREYFHLIIRLDQLKDDPLLAKSVTDRLEKIRSDQGFSEGTELFRFKGASNLTLMGEVDLFQAQELLKASQLEVLPWLGKGILCLTVVDYPESTMEPYREFFLSMIVRKIGSLSRGLGLWYFGAVIDRPSLREHFEREWDIPYAVGQINVLGLKPQESDVEIATGVKTRLRLRMGAKKMASPIVANYDRVMSYTEKNKDRVPLVLETSGTEYRRSFDAAIDRFEIHADDPRTTLLKALSFCPMSWVFIEHQVGRVAFANATP